MFKPLVLRCADQPITDHMQINVDPSNSARVDLHNKEGNHVALVSLDEEGARQLFNWLGVWLHRR